MEEKNKDINNALVESKREPIYTAMKYWGKKPHNIWATYIDNYTGENGVFLDAFAGSGMSAIESLRLKRKTIAFDINPLTSFLLNIYTMPFNQQEFQKYAKQIIETIKNNEIYQKLWAYSGTEFHNFKYNKNKIYEICTIDKKIIKSPNPQDYEVIKFADTLNLANLGIDFIDEPFLDSQSFNVNFINSIGGNNFKYIWTKRNLIVLSLIFKEILNVTKTDIKEQLLFGFIMIVHLCCKMNIPRNDKSNRNFSTSWGRSAYIVSSRQMEQNPLLLFEKNCFGKQSVTTALNYSNNYIDKTNLNIKEISNSNKQKNINAFNLKYGTINILKLDDYLNENSVDFILTDPPYGGLVQYLDLSYLWLLWLKKYDDKYGNIDFNNEITINKKFDIKVYEARFTRALKQLYRVLKDNGKMVITFHNKNISIWNSFIRSLQNAGFIIEKVIHQKNRRSGESVVANPYGTSGTDFYLRCVKNKNKRNSNVQLDNLNEKIVEIAINSIALRNEPTPYEILFDAILANITSNGYIFSDDCDGDIKTALNREIDNIFIITEDSSVKAGNLWWFKNPEKYIRYQNIPLSERVDRLVLYILKRDSIVTLDDMLGVIYRAFPNGLTPDESSIINSLKKYGIKSSGSWSYNPNSTASLEATLHTEYIYKLSRIGKKLGYKIYIGKREQHENIESKQLKDFADVLDINFSTDDFINERMSFIDILFIKNGDIKYAFEIENSTNIISAFHRCSVLNESVNKFIVIPKKREKELLSKQDPLFIDSANKYNWKYLLYEDIDKLNNTIKPDISIFSKDVTNGNI